MIIAIESTIYSLILLAENFTETFNCYDIFHTSIDTCHLKNSFTYTILFNPHKTL